MEVNNFVSVYEDNFKSFYDQYFAESLMKMQNRHLVHKGKLPASLANFIIWLSQRKDIISAEFYVKLSRFEIKFNAKGYPIVEHLNLFEELHTYKPHPLQFPTDDEEIKQAISAFSPADSTDISWDKSVINEYKYLYYEGNIPDVFHFYCQLRDKKHLRGAYIKDCDTILQIDKFNGVKIRHTKRSTTRVLYIDDFVNYSLKEKLKIIDIITGSLQIRKLYESIKTGYRSSDFINCPPHYAKVEYCMNTTLADSMTVKLPADMICKIQKKNIINEKFVIMLLDPSENKFTFVIILRRTYNKIFNHFLLLNNLRTAGQ